MSNAVETYYENGVWCNRVQKTARPDSSFATKEPAVAAGRKLAMALKTEHIVKREDGTVEYRNSYGNDPYPPRG